MSDLLHQHEIGLKNQLPPESYCKVAIPQLSRTLDTSKTFSIVLNHPTMNSKASNSEAPPASQQDSLRSHNHSPSPSGTGQSRSDANQDPSQARESMSNSTGIDNDSEKQQHMKNGNSSSWQQGGSAGSSSSDIPSAESGLPGETNGGVSGDKSMNVNVNMNSNSHGHGHRPRSNGSTAQQYDSTSLSGGAGGGMTGMMHPPPLDAMTMDRRGSGHSSHPDHPNDQDPNSALLYGNGGGGPFHHPHHSAPPLSHANNPYAHSLDTSAHGGGVGGSSASPYNLGGGRDSRSGAGSSLPFTDNMVAAAKIRAAGMAAAAAERDYQYAALNLQRQLEAAELAKKRHQLLGGFPGSAGAGGSGGPMNNGGAGAGRPGGNPSHNPHGPPVEDDLEVAQACLNLRQDLKEDPDYLRFLQNRNLLHSGMLLHGAGGRSDRSLPGAAAAAAAAAARGMMQHQQHHPSAMDGHMLGGGPGGAPNLSMMDPGGHPSGHFYPPMDGFDAAHRSASMGLGGMAGGVAGGMKSDPYGMMGMPGMRGGDAKFNAMHGMGGVGGHMNDVASVKKERKPSRPEMTTRKETKKGKRPADMPRRPLSAYNFFFSEERERVLAALPDPSGQNGGDDAKKESEDAKKDETLMATNPAADSTDQVKKDESSETTTDEATKDSEAADKEDDKKQSNTERLLALRNSQRNVRRPHRKTHGKIGFKALAKLIGERWRALPAEKREYYTKLAETDLARYKEQMKEYHRKNKWSFLQQGKEGTPSN
jgi:hypothetical protein